MKNCPSRRSGFSLLEVLLSISVLGFVVASFADMTTHGMRSARSGATNLGVDASLRRALDRIAREMSAAVAVTLTPDPTTDFGAEALEFRPAEGAAGGVPTLGPRTHIGFEYAPGEIDNGIDDNGDGLVDEGSVVLTRNFGTPAALRVNLLKRVPELMPGEFLNGVDDNGNGVIDEMGLSFHMQGDALTLRVAVQVPGAGQARIVRTAQRTFLVRN